MDVANKSIGTLQGLPFDNLIGGPLNACIQAQNDAAMTSINFINNVCLNEDKETGEKSAVYVSFSFIQNGRKVVINVPMIAIVPIPYIAINSIDISFKATVNGVESESSSTETEYESKGTKKSTRKTGWFRKKTTTINSTFSTKRDSKSTQDSKFSVEATIDVAVHAGQESMPAGMAKILEMLGAAMDLCSPDGELSVNDTTFYAEKNANDKDRSLEIFSCKKSDYSRRYHRYSICLLTQYASFVQFQDKMKAKFSNDRFGFNYVCPQKEISIRQYRSYCC